MVSDDLTARLAEAERRIAHLTGVVDRERLAREGRRELQRLAAASVAADTIDAVASAIVEGASQVLGSHMTTIALPDGDEVRFVHIATAPAHLRADWTTAPRSTPVPLVRALDDDATWIELLDRAQLDEWPLLAAEAERANLASYVAIPLRSRSSRMPVASLGVGFDAATTLDELDRTLMAELSQLASDALVRAGHLQHARTVAETLQHALLPRRLPVIDGLALRALYQPAQGPTDVGGDWYDVVRLDDDRVGLVVGDVAGHDMASAAEMGRIRHVLASHLLEHGDPAVALTITDRYFHHVDESMFATAVVMVVDGPRENLVVASAAHLPPLLVDAGGAATIAVSPGPPIGSGLGGYDSVEVPLPPDSSVVAFTDGVVERRGRSLDDAVTDLAARLATSTDRRPAAVLRRLRDHLETPERVDDAAVLIATRP